MLEQHSDLSGTLEEEGWREGRKRQGEVTGWWDEREEKFN